MGEMEMPAARKSRHYVFTLNNPTYPEMVAFDNQCVKLTVPVIDYMIRGFEGYGQNKTPHIQGAVCFCKPVTWRQAKEYLGPRTHVEACNSLFSASIHYCRKEGDYKEFGNALVAIMAKYPLTQELDMSPFTQEEYLPFDKFDHFHKELAFIKEEEDFEEYQYQYSLKIKIGE